MQELRVTDPTDPKAVVRLKLTQGALGIADIYVDGAWARRRTWTLFAGFSDEPVSAGPLSEELAVQFHKLVSTRRTHHAASEAGPAIRNGRVGNRRRAV